MIEIIYEHYNGIYPKKEYNFKGTLNFEQDFICQVTKKKRAEVVNCCQVYSDEINSKHYISNSYYVGLDWLIEKEKAIYVQPKLNIDANETDYLKMLFSALKHPEICNHTEDLFHIK